MAIARILRCNPFVRGGVDRVPDHFTLRRNLDEQDEGYVFAKIELEKAEKEKIEGLLEDYQEELVIRDLSVKAVDVLKRIADVKEEAIDQLPVEVVEQYEEEWGSEKESLAFFKVVPNEKNQSFFEHVHHDELSHHIESKQSPHPIAVLINRKRGMMETNSPLLEKTFILEYGVTQKEIDEKSTSLLLYLLLLREKFDGIPMDQ